MRLLPVPRVSRAVVISASALALLGAGLMSPPPAAAVSDSSITFTQGPVTGPPPAKLGRMWMSSLGTDDRTTGESVTSVSPLTFSAPAVHHRIGDGWNTWSHGYQGDVYQTTGMTITLPKKTAAFSFYAEPEHYAELTITATSSDGSTSNAVPVQGYAGAEMFGFYSTKPMTDFITSVTVSSADISFAVGEFAIQSSLGHYVAMGDSYSSGEGTYLYSSVTDRSADRCHRSPRAYAPLAVKRDTALKPLDFVACSGSTTADLGRRNHLYPVEFPQLDNLSTLTTDVTLTIGGNDVDFAGVLDACIKARSHANGRGCSTKKEVTQPVQSRIDRLSGKGTATAPGDVPITPIAELLATIHGRAPKATVYLSGYPELFGSDKKHFRKDKTSPSGYVCDVNPLAAASFDYTDTQWMNARAHDLNVTLRDATRAAAKADSTLKVKWVSAGTFNDHGLCDAKTAWVNPLILDVSAADQATYHATVDGRRIGFAASPGSFHPTQTGQKSGYLAAFDKAGLY